MVIPNMGAFIAWGFITALFIPTGWLPNADLAKLVDPMIKYMLPSLLAYTGGNLIHGQRGGVAGVVGTIGLIVGAPIPMFLGAMIMGPFSAWVIKKWDNTIQHRIRSGFEMIVNNFALGIIGFLLCLASYKFIGPGVLWINHLLTTAVNALVSTGVLPILSLLNEPAKVLFLNNVIDQGIYYPLGMQQAAVAGKSIFFMVASNPGPGLGLLLAYWFFSGSKIMRETAPGAIIIHFFGGIHEIYFPFVLAKPVTLIGMIAGAASGIATAQIMHVGLVAGPSPGSIFAYFLLTPRGNFVGMIADVAIATIVSFTVNSLILAASRKHDRAKEQDLDFEALQAQSAAMKQEGKDVLAATLTSSSAQDAAAMEATPSQHIHKVVFACDAGMGSSTMGASLFRKRVEKAGLTVEVANSSIEKVPADADVIVTHKNLVDRTRLANEGVRVVPIDNYLSDANLEELFSSIESEQGANA
ncbi:MAG: PTS mannitol transporter subunit IICB [Acidipropionibacterium sp.]|jgi:PTS system mannitol-specific IIC component|nr:PTS mannitol transporter subunit IICB [Acidipropionibacterium sp.]